MNLSEINFIEFHTKCLNQPTKLYFLARLFDFESVEGSIEADTASDQIDRLREIEGSTVVFFQARISYGFSACWSLERQFLTTRTILIVRI